MKASEIYDSGWGEHYYIAIPWNETRTEWFRVHWIKECRTGYDRWVSPDIHLAIIPGSNYMVSIWIYGISDDDLPKCHSAFDTAEEAMRAADKMFARLGAFL